MGGEPSGCDDNTRQASRSCHMHGSSIERQGEIAASKQRSQFWNRRHAGHGDAWAFHQTTDPIDVSALFAGPDKNNMTIRGGYELVGSFRKLFIGPSLWVTTAGLCNECDGRSVLHEATVSAKHFNSGKFDGREGNSGLEIALRQIEQRQ